MPCIHLRQLYELCEKHELRISSHDAIRIVCRQCEEQEVCPSSLTDGENVLQLSPQDSPTEANKTTEDSANAGDSDAAPEGTTRPK
jgi:hypothetical protein